jgi:type IV pilus biogenesis protein PilP
MANRGKEILALCLGVATFAVAIYTFRSNPGARYTSPKHAARTEASRLREVRSALGQMKAPNAPPREQVLAEAKLGVLNRNPFSRPVGSPSAAPAPEPAPAQPAAAVAQTPQPAAPAPAAPVTTVLPPLTTQTPPLGTTAAPAPTTPSLAGIVGDRSGYQTAVIRIGNGRYFAKQGDKVAGRYLVQSVSDRQVVLAGAEGKLTLKMGGSE